MSKKWVYIGQFTKSHGLKGELKLSNRDNYSSLVPNIILSIGDHNNSYKIDSIRGANKEILKLDGINSIEEGSSLIGKKVFALTSSLPELKEDEYYLAKVVSFDLISSSSRKNIGKIKMFYNNGAHFIAVVEDSSSNEFDIPLIEGSIKKIDYSKKLVIADVNEGLLSL